MPSSCTICPPTAVRGWRRRSSKGRRRSGRAGRFGWGLRPSSDTVLDVVIEAAESLSRERHGGLLVLERETGLEEDADTGIRLDATPSAELLGGLFYPNSPLH